MAAPPAGVDQAAVRGQVVAREAEVAPRRREPMEIRVAALVDAPEQPVAALETRADRVRPPQGVLKGQAPVVRAAVERVVAPAAVVCRVELRQWPTICACNRMRLHPPRWNIVPTSTRPRRRLPS